MNWLLAICLFPAVMIIVVGFIGLVALDRQEMRFKKEFPDQEDECKT